MQDRKNPAFQLELKDEQASRGKANCRNDGAQVHNPKKRQKDLIDFQNQGSHGKSCSI